MNLDRILMLARLCGIITGIIIIFFILKYTLILLYPFIIAFTIAIFLNPLISYLETNWKLHRAISICLIMSLVFIVVIGSSILMMNELLQGIIFLSDKIPIYFKAFTDEVNQFIHDHVMPYYNRLTSFFNTLNPSQQRIISHYVEDSLSHMGTLGAMFLQSILLKVRTLLSYLPQSFTAMIFILLATFLITKDLPHIQTWLRKVFPARARKSSIVVFRQVQVLLFSYVKAQLSIISITAVIIFLGLSIIGVNHALTIALLTAIVDLLPFIGTGTVFIPWIFYLFFTGNYSLTIQLTILYMFIVIVRQIVEPKVLSDHLGVRPVITLIVMFACYQVWGIIGIVIAPFLIVFYNAFNRAGVIKLIVRFVMS